MAKIMSVQASTSDNMPRWNKVDTSIAAENNIPTPAENLLGARSVGLLPILNCLITASLKIPSKLYFPNVLARNAKSTIRKAGINQTDVTRNMIVNTKTKKAIILALYSLITTKSTGHSNSLFMAQI
jgi:hypothetical protein